MTHEELLEQTLIELDDDRLAKFAEPALRRAEQAIVARLWPYDEDKTWDDVPERHHMTACEIAVIMVNRRGAEGETSHSESGTSRSYESAGIPDSLLRGIVPRVGVPR